MELTITALTPETLVALLLRTGASVTTEMVTADVAAGAPTNSDGTINLVHYAAWLVKERATRGN